MGALPRKDQSHRIVIIGGGAGGLELACRLGRQSDRKPVSVVLVDRNTVHVWKPRLHEIAAGLTGSDEAETSYLSLGYSHGFEFCFGELTGWSGEARTVTIAGVKSIETGEELLGDRTLSYDALVFAVGCRVNDFGTPGVVNYCHMLDGAAQALRFQHAFIEAAVKASAGALPRVRVGIVGAGATGVELAAELHHSAHAMERYGALSAAGRLDITLVDQAPRILPAVDPRTSSSALATLQRLGVKVLLGQGVKQVSKDGLHLTNGDVVPCEIMVWSSGIAGQAIASRLGLPLTKGNRIAVDGYLACVGLPDIYAIGDCAAAPGEGGKGILPPTAQVAHQQAAYLAQALARRIEGSPSPPFRYRPRGTLVSLGAGEAAAEFSVPGRPARALPAHGAIAKILYVMLFHAHRATLHGWPRAAALFAADRLRRTAIPIVKLH